MGRCKDKKIDFLLRILLYTIVLSFVAGCGGVASKKTTYQQSDLEGTWIMNGFIKSNYDDFGSYGFMAIDVSGKILEGAAVNFGVDKQKVTGGYLEITTEGSITGHIDFFLPDINAYQKQTIPNGQMTGEKNILVHASDFTVSRKGIGVFVKKAGIFTSSDLEGTWVFPTDGVFDVSVDGSGVITHCSYHSFKDTPEECNGNISITPDGNISGEIETVSKKKLRIWFEGQMPRTKESMILAGSISTRFGGMATLAIKRTGKFSTTNISGTWKIFIASYNDALYGTVDIDGSGMVTGGDWRSLKGKAGTFTISELSLTRQGNISGVIGTSTGDTYTLLGGQINPMMNLAAILDRDDAGRYGMVIMVRADSP